MNKYPAINIVREYFEYNPNTGNITRLKSYGRAIVGHEFTMPYNVSVFGAAIDFATLAWALHHGKWPENIVDHIDRDGWNNKIGNLREATPTQNQYNKAGTGKYPKGVTWRDRNNKPWQAKIRVDGIRYHLGSFTSIEEAHEAYILAALEHHGEFACLE